MSKRDVLNKLFYDVHIQLKAFNPSLSLSLFLTVFPEAPDASEVEEYPDDFEEAEVEEEDEAALVHTDDAVEEEFQLCDAGGLTITLKALKEKG